MKKGLFEVAVLILLFATFIAGCIFSTGMSANVGRVVERVAENQKQIEAEGIGSGKTYTWPPKPNGVSQEYWDELKENSRTNDGRYYCPDFSRYDWSGVSYPGFGD